MKGRKSSAAMSAAGLLFVAGCAGGQTVGSAPTAALPPSSAFAKASAAGVTLSIAVPSQPQQLSERRGQAVSPSTSKVFIAVVPPSGSAVSNGPYYLGSPPCPFNGSYYVCSGITAPAATAAPGLYDQFIVDLYTAGGALLTTNHYNPGDGYQYIYTGSAYNAVSVHEQPVVSKIWFESPSQCVPAIGGNAQNIYVDFLDAAGSEVTGYFANPLSVTVGGAGQFTYWGGSTSTTAVVGYAGNGYPSSNNLQLSNAAPAYAALSFAGANGLNPAAAQYPALYSVAGGIATVDNSATVTLTGLTRAGGQMPCGTYNLGSGSALSAVEVGGGRYVFLADTAQSRIDVLDFAANDATTTLGTSPTTQWKTSTTAVAAGLNGGSGALAVDTIGASYVFAATGSGVSAWSFDGSFHALWGPYNIGVSPRSLSLAGNVSGTRDVWVAGGSSVCAINVGVIWNASSYQCYDMYSALGLTGVAVNSVAVDRGNTTQFGMARATYAGSDEFIFFNRNGSSFSMYAQGTGTNGNGRGVAITNGTDLIVATSGGVQHATIGTSFSGSPPSFSPFIYGAFQAVDASGSPIALGQAASSSAFSFYGTVYSVALPPNTVAAAGGILGSGTLSVNRRTR